MKGLYEHLSSSAASLLKIYFFLKKETKQVLAEMKTGRGENTWTLILILPQNHPKMPGPASASSCPMAAQSQSTSMLLLYLLFCYR